MPPSQQSFTHLHVASGWSLQHGTDTPAALVERAAADGQHALALTDRDGLRGAVKHVIACAQEGVVPILGMELAVEPSDLLHRTGRGRVADSHDHGGGRAPVRGGAAVDARLPRVVVLAHGSSTSLTAAAGWTPDPGDPPLPTGVGWARLCRLSTAAHTRGEAPGSLSAVGGRRGTPVTTLEEIAEHAVDPASGAPALTVLLGPDSEVGRALLARRPDLARALLARWYSALPLGCLALEVVCHLGPEGTPASLGHAARTLALAREAGIPAVLTNAVRHAGPEGAATADVLDAARRLVPLASRHLDRATGHGWLKPAAAMRDLAERIATAAGAGRGACQSGGAAQLLADTERLAARCHLDPRADLGIGAVHLPEPWLVAGPAVRTVDDAAAVLRARCEAAVHTRYPSASLAHLQRVRHRMDEELGVIGALGFPTYFLTVAEVCDLTRRLGVRVAARGSGAGSLVNHLLGISGVDPIAHGLLMERFLTTARAELPDIDVDVESARRTEVYDAVLARFGGDRVAAVAMTDTYRVRHAVRDVGAALGMPPGEVDAIAKAFPHLRARDVRHALRDLPELRASGLADSRLDLLYDLVESLDGLPRHTALHPCGVLLSDASLLDRTPVQPSATSFPMSSFDKDDVEVMGLLKLDVLGIRMQSAFAHATREVERTTGERIDLDTLPLDDDDAFRLIRSTRTLGCFQIESPGQRELVGKFAPQDFADLVIDISLFRPGPVKSDMVTPFLMARQGWRAPDYLHERLRKALEQTCGVVVFHEQVLQIVAETAGVSLTQADEVRRALGTRDGQAEVETWWRPRALAAGFTPAEVQRIWEVLAAFASFGFCKAHAAAFALPTYQSAWFKAHWPAHFLAGVLTHDPGMYPKRLILDDARTMGVAVLPLDVNASTGEYRVEHVAPWDEPPPAVLQQYPAGPGRDDDDERPRPAPAQPPRWSEREAAERYGPSASRYRLDAAVPDGRAWGIRLSLAEVKGISDAEVARIVAGQPYHSLADLWNRARPSRPVLERLVLTGALDAIYGLGLTAPVRRRGVVTRRDLLLQVADLDRHTRALDRGAARTRSSSSSRSTPRDHGKLATSEDVQLALDLGDAPGDVEPSGLPEMTPAEQVRTELEVLGLDASHHVVAAYGPMLDAIGVVRSSALRGQRSRSELLVAGVKVATQTPPIRSGRRVVFLTLDDSTGPVDATFFEDAQGPYASTVFGSWLLVVRGELRRTGPRGVSLRATGAWAMPALWRVWSEHGVDGVYRVMAGQPAAGYGSAAVAGAAASRSTRPVMAPSRVIGQGRDDGAVPGLDAGRSGPGQHDERYAGAGAREAAAQDEAALRAAQEAAEEAAEEAAAASGLPVGDRPRSERGRAGGRRVFVHASGFLLSPYADIAPPGSDTRNTRVSAAGAAGSGDGGADQTVERSADDALEDLLDAERGAAGRGAPRKLWHSSSGSAGW
ncbi:DNA polymerase III, alpha subunit [Quadrisphaera granulorum]|uniref:DNA polymerase III subunit alpha n=1 Tax=Quadrisphaera granulorum TaxID=317664 RepID=A0A316A736_9ACTN|nr:PHP domain-containing protein [Quadrisphaera granulorum]PWJ53691.1 DNA polymerase III alpha subunit [Quadrisphaera granulorum]SZE96735.1 DNA polymerase III, alpha subunit [Quadrisphaera granulorum]